MIAEGRERGRDYTATQVIPFFRALYDRKLLDAYAGVALSSLALPGSEEWRLANAASIEAYTQFLGGTK
jgi:hypothetical protein